MSPHRRHPIFLLHKIGKICKNLFAFYISRDIIKTVKEETAKEVTNMTTLNIQAITELGCCVYATIKVSEDYTMNEVVIEVKRLRYTHFRLINTMKRFVKI